MRYCPKCDAEYREGMTTCSDDGTPLLTKEQYDASCAARGDAGKAKLFSFRLTSILTLSDQFEAEELAEGLLEEGVDVALVSSKARTMGDATAPGPETYSLVVPENESAKALALVTEWRAGLEASQDQAELDAETEEASSEAK